MDSGFRRMPQRICVLYGEMFELQSAGSFRKAYPEPFRSWSTLLNPDFSHNPDVEHVWRTWQTRLVAYHANNPKVGEGKPRGTRGGSIPSPLTTLVLATPLHRSVHVPALPAPANPAPLKPAYAIAPLSPPPARSTHTAVAPPPYLYSPCHFHHPQQLQQSNYSHRPYSGAYGAWPLPYPIYLAPNPTLPSHFLLHHRVLFGASVVISNDSNSISPNESEGPDQQEFHSGVSWLDTPLTVFSSLSWVVWNLVHTSSLLRVHDHTRFSSAHDLPFEDRPLNPDSCLATLITAPPKSSVTGD